MKLINKTAIVGISLILLLLAGIFTANWKQRTIECENLKIEAEGSPGYDLLPAEKRTCNRHGIYIITHD